jgi:putative ABC transport system permease protein
MPAEQPPGFAGFLVRLLVPSHRAELILGDLAEDFALAVERRGAAAARRAYWRGALLSTLDAGRWHRRPREERHVARTDRRRLRTLDAAEAFTAELRYAMRSLLRRPAFTSVVVATLAVATGAATAVFSVVNGVLLQPLPYARPHELVTVWKSDASRRADPAFADSWNRIGVSLVELDALAGDAAFSAVAGYRTERGIVDATGEPEEVIVARAAPALLPLLGITPLLGAWFDDATDDVAVISYERWRGAFGADAGVLGRAVRIDERAYTIVGVLPRGFGIEPLSPFMQQGRPAVWVPAGGSPLDERARDFEAIARVAPMVPLTGAEQAAHRVLAATARSADGVHIEPRQQTETATIRGPLLLVLASVGLFVLLACVNVASLMLGEGESRERELLTRVALGASRHRMIGMLLLESACLAAAGTAAGALLAGPMRDGLLALAPFSLPAGSDVRIDATTMLFATLLAVVVTLGFGTAPAWTLSGAAARAARSAGGTARRRGVMRHALIAAQFGLATVLLVSAGLLAHSLVRESRVHPGFTAVDRVVVQVRRPAGVDPDFAARVRARLAQVPGVDRVVVTSRVPLLDAANGWSVTRSPDRSGEGAVIVTLESVSDGYFEALGVPLLEGRGIDARDERGADRVAVVSRALAAQLWPGGSAVGQVLTDPFNRYTVVGVVADVRDVALDRLPDGVFYAAHAQGGLPGGTSFIVQSARDAAAVMPELRAAVREAAPSAPVLKLRPLQQVLNDVVAADRYRALLAGLVAFAAALMAAIGLAGAVTRDVTRRLREFAIRMALGATAMRVARIPIVHATASVVVGALVGAVGSVAASRALGAWLYGVSAADPVALIGAAAVLSAIVLVTLGLALRRTSQPDLMRRLNEEQ